MAVLALAVSGLFGGLDKVGTAEIPTIAEDTFHSGQPWNVTVTGAGWTDGTTPIKVVDEGNRWIIIGVTVEVTDVESRNDMRDIVRLRGVPGLVGDSGPRGVPPDRQLLGKDGAGAGVGRLNPNMPEKLLYFWEQKADGDPPRELTVEIWGKTHRASSLTEHMEWLDPEVKALVTLSVKDVNE